MSESTVFPLDEVFPWQVGFGIELLSPGELGFLGCGGVGPPRADLV